MIPVRNAAFQQDFTRKEESSNTYRVISVDKKIAGHCDGIEAVIQAVDKILSTERYQYPIYSWNYGIELADLIGMPISYCVAELERRIQDALLSDDRIKEITDFSFRSITKRDLEVKFTIKSSQGTADFRKEMRI